MEGKQGDRGKSFEGLTRSASDPRSKQMGSEYSPRLWRIHELLEDLGNRVRHQVEAPSMSSCLSNIAERDEHEEHRKACDNSTKIDGCERILTSVKTKR